MYIWIYINIDPQNTLTHTVLVLLRGQTSDGVFLYKVLCMYIVSLANIHAHIYIDTPRGKAGAGVILEKVLYMCILPLVHIFSHSYVYFPVDEALYIRFLQLNTQQSMKSHIT